MNTDKRVVSSPKKVVEGIREAFEGIAHMLEGIIEQLEELEETEPADGVFCEDTPATGAPPVDTAAKKPAGKRQRKTPEKKAKAEKDKAVKDTAEELPEEAQTVDEADGAPEESAGGVDAVDASEAEGSADSAADTPPWEPPKDTGQHETGQGAKPAAPNTEAASKSITKDDITSVIVAKIKQNRNNNEKIGQLLTAYGVKALSNLPEEKYEAFLADISQI